MFSKTLLLFLIVNFVSDSCGQVSKKKFRNDYKYFEEFESFYKIHPIPKNWMESKRACELEGGILWHPENDAEANALLTFWNETLPKVKWVWMGSSDLLVEGVFETVDNRPVSEVYNNWAPDKPDDSEKGEDCLYMYLTAEPGYVDDNRCDDRICFICKKTLKSLEWNHQCNMPYTDYSYNEDNGKCYKLHTTPLNWTEAYAMCQVEQSFLAVINNNREANYLANLAESTPKPRFRTKHSRGIYHVGFHNRFNEDWRTVKGTKLKIDSKAWYENYVPDGDTYEQCGSMFFNGRLINTDCDTKCFFICEHEVESGAITTSFMDILHPYFGGGFEY